MSMKMGAALFVVSMVFGCFDPAQEASHALAQEPAGTLNVKITADKLIRLSASSQQPVERVIAVTTSRSSPDKRTIDLGIKSIDLRVGGKRCHAEGDGPTVKMTCDAGIPNSTVDAAATEAKPSAGATERVTVASDFQQIVTVDPGMYCGLHYGQPKWQARFRVAIAGEPGALASVQSVNYDVFAAYAGNGHIVGSDPASNFSTTSGFLTPVSGWRTGGAKITLKSGEQLSIPGAVIQWTNPEPDTKPTGEACSAAQALD